jgi:hypothetical protein
MLQHDPDNLEGSVRMNTAKRQAANRRSVNDQLLCLIFFAGLFIAGAGLAARGQDQAPPLSPPRDRLLRRPAGFRA